MFKVRTAHSDKGAAGCPLRIKGGLPVSAASALEEEVSLLLAWNVLDTTCMGQSREASCNRSSGPLGSTLCLMLLTRTYFSKQDSCTNLPQAAALKCLFL